MSTYCVKFLHPGGEHQPDSRSSDHKAWNDGPHRRKFMVGAGQIIDRDGGRPRSSRISFWGEWEPPSTIVHSFGQESRMPQYVHEPFLEFPEHHNSLQNTDPFVFGDRFRYTVCRQYARGNPTILRDLPEGSVILFGSCVGGKFALDTVFVVDRGSFLWNHESRPEQVEGDTDTIYLDATINRLQADKTYRLYSGVRYEDRKQFGGIYSFVPCQVLNGEFSRFSRPVVDLPDIGHRQTQGYKILSREEDRSKTIWKEVVRQVLEQECALATSIKMPARVGERISSVATGRGDSCVPIDKLIVC